MAVSLNRNGQSDVPSSQSNSAISVATSGDDENVSIS